MKRVVVTGMASITSLGEDAATIMQRMQAGASGIRYMPEWERYADLRNRLGEKSTPLFQNGLSN